MPVIIAKPCVSAIIFDILKERRKFIMTKEELAARKRWDTSIMTEEEKEARIQRILSHCGVIDDDTFVVPPDAVPPVREIF